MNSIHRNMNDYVFYNNSNNNPDYSINYYSLHNQNKYAQCLHLQPRLLTTNRIISIPTKTTSELISSKSTQSIKASQENAKKGDKLLRNREWDNRYFSRNKLHKRRNNSWDILSTNTIYNSQNNNYHYTTYSNHIETSYYDTGYYPSYSLLSNRSRHFDRNNPYSKHQQRRLKSFDVSYTNDNEKSKRNKYTKHNRENSNKEIQRKVKEECLPTQTHPQQPPPPAPPITEDLLKSIQKPSGILNRVKVVKSIPQETGVTYDAVVDELKNKLQTIRKNSGDSALGFFDKFSNKPRKESEKIKEQIREPSFADMLKQVQLKPSKKKIQEIEDEKSNCNNSASIETKKEIVSLAIEQNEAPQSSNNENKEKQDIESNPSNNQTIKIIGNQTFNINMNIQNGQNNQVFNGDLTNNVTSFSTRNLFTKEMNNYQQRDRDLYKNAFRNKITNSNSNNSKLTASQTPSTQKEDHELYDFNSIGFKYDVFKMIFSNSKLLKNKLNVNNNCFDIENSLYDSLAFSK
jgi:hypothetical protein